MTLAQKTCVPCRGGMPALGKPEAEKLLKEIPDWDLLDNATKISRTYRFKDFMEALTFVQQVARTAEGEGHHPDITFGWGYATVMYYTHKIKGLHENDFVMAAKADELYAGGAGETHKH